MTVITATDLKQNTMRLQEALRDDLLITKRNKPFVVVMDYEKYRKIETYIETLKEMPKSEKTHDNDYPSITLEEANTRVARAVEEYRTNGLKNTHPLDDAFWNSLDAHIQAASAGK
jgi:prevent-host-death family protein